ncbi:DUF6036 family nucleotidyltransferase [Petroclostridium sp. X23]|uniref:DUF6036 family nucleotidyltransferase n=1 Tax=Petroclostridium sp. X23 TaxID=3045146 RepID=UPI0024ADADFD|nr:DUF6036 family nucleotidyltransferase [Petroclostridium sp. X23]WHH59244.1 DUF6036 family nucleotidyltransferase [Petroclostridium sp. X23]
MHSYDLMIEELKNMEKIAIVLGTEPFPMYFLGGSACILGKYTERATRDFDFIDLDYSAKLGKVFRYLGDFDILEYESTILSPFFRDRAIRLEQFEYLQIFILSKEDIIVSKIIRMEQKDLEDINLLIKKSDTKLILQIIDEVLQRKDLYESKRNTFIEKLSVFKERYNV